MSISGYFITSYTEKRLYIKSINLVLSILILNQFNINYGSKTLICHWILKVNSGKMHQGILNYHMLKKNLS